MSSLLPSIAALGLWGYWVIGLMAFGEAFVLTSVFSPGTVVVVLGGALAAQGIYGVFDMMWFVAIGTILGSQASFWLGTKGEMLFGDGHAVLSTANLERDRRFFAKYGGASIVIGHFLGPLRPIAPVVAGLSGMGSRRFLLWNVAAGAAYAIALVSVGYFFGTAFHIFGPTTTRVGLFAGAVLVVLALLWFLISRLRRDGLSRSPSCVRSQSRFGTIPTSRASSNVIRSCFGFSPPGCRRKPSGDCRRRCWGSHSCIFSASMPNWRWRW